MPLGSSTDGNLISMLTKIPCFIMYVMELCTVDVQQYVQSIWLRRIYCVKTNIFPEYRPVLILQAGQGALELLLVLVFQVGQQHVLSAGWVMVQGWAGVTQEVLIFIPESPTQETAHWATSTQPPAAQSRAKDNMGQAKAGQGKQGEERYYRRRHNETRLDRMEREARTKGLCQVSPSKY